MQNLNDLYYFAAVVEHGGFSPAGRALGIQKSRLSRRILLLEEQLGARLLNRSSRRFSVTEIGHKFYERCVAMIVEAEAAEQVVAQVRAEPRGVVRMSCPTALLSFQFGELVARFMVQNPGIQVHLESTNRRVDVIAEGFDLAIRVRFPPMEATDLVMRRLDESTQCLVAAPALTVGDLGSPTDLSRLPGVDLDRPGRIHIWKFHNAEGRSVTVPLSPRLVTDDLSVLHNAALAGVGIALLPTIIVRDDVRAGQLMHLLPDWQPTTGIVHAVFPSHRGLLPSVRTLVDFLAQECAYQRARADRLVPAFGA